MKILNLSDLHIHSRNIINFPLTSYFKNKINNLIVDNDPDVVIITGDIFESSVYKGMHESLAGIFGDRTVICCLGNHEFFYKTVEKTLEDYKNDYNPDKYDVHYLDVVGNKLIDNVNFIGNVLWYDGSMSTIDEQNLYQWNGWMDQTIMNFNYLTASENCVNQIKENILDTHTNVLCTHTVPHSLMNGHMSKLDSPYNAYSGIAKLVENINVQYSFSGHTHWKEENVINNTKCYNPGSDYGNLQYFIIEI
jgi:predicted phosphodiesterase